MALTAVENRPPAREGFVTVNADGYAAERKKWREFPRIRPSDTVTPGPGQESVWDYLRGRDTHSRQEQQARQDARFHVITG
jgi:hypothetical protein